MLATMAAPGAAFAQSCMQQPLCADQANLLSPFDSLLNSPAGLAVLDANMQTEEDIYADATRGPEGARRGKFAHRLCRQQHSDRRIPEQSEFLFQRGRDSQRDDACPDVGHDRGEFRNQQPGQRRRRLAT